jgi:ppGpp synthetase/RelA/SpoT-type nucleotidyltranferase
MDVPREESPELEIAKEGKVINLGSFDDFRSLPLLQPIIKQYAYDAILARYAVKQIWDDLVDLKLEYAAKHPRGREIFTVIKGRVKTEDSVLRKLYKMCCEKGQYLGITQETLLKLYSDIKDICGIRFACPYFDEVKRAIDEIVRPKLKEWGYATDLQSDPRYPDKDYLDIGDEFGYRSYHFFVKVPTIIDIFGERKLCVCEVQARTELQHVWADKSHDLLYKPKLGWDFSDKHVIEDMRQVSNSLRAADGFLVSIRDRLMTK